MEQLSCWKTNGPSRNIAIEMGVQHCPECPIHLRVHVSNHWNERTQAKPRETPPHHYASTTKLNSRHNAVTEETFAGHPPNPDEWSSYPAGRQMGLPRNIAIEMGVQHCPECPIHLRVHVSNHWNERTQAKPRETPPHHYASTTKLNSRHNAVTEETFAGHPPNPDASIRLPYW
ncbi:hypothetical protein TNCV_3186581 [Trichonephila clavipes]|nr:hypothetical protein TNCV_3186581 [Trichonephila clavipes]